MSIGFLVAAFLFITFYLVDLITELNYLVKINYFIIKNKIVQYKRLVSSL